MRKRIVRRHSAIIAATTLLALGVTAPPALAAAPEHRVTGFGENEQGGAYSLTARGSSTEASGRLTVRGPNSEYVGDVDCLSVTGDTAVVTGTTIKGHAYQYFQFIVIDGGTRTEPDRVLLWIAADDRFDCAAPEYPGPFMDTITKGDFKVWP
ncbi:MULTISPECIES: hypothetical protein [Pseudarthrobacter]|jgi:hypothetical protein|uniref:hypothetical protein n=1 Tax=Pseudarthrobacter TaxID=1742993 RepID=UPI0013DB7DBD|nr:MULTISPECIES: hypothetical protein [Pseudarthrobacter]MDP9998272.1 hypothetical protein [Pseudarthrobacter sulfonivorans]